MKWSRYGPNALLIRFADRLGDSTFAQGRAIVAELQRNPPWGLTHFVPAFTTVLLEFAPGRTGPVEDFADAVVAQLKAALKIKLPPPTVTEIPVLYNGPDLARVAEHCRLTPDDVGRLHAERTYKVYLLGFSPGFPYLGDLNPKLHTPRLPSPRPRVAAGSVAIGGEHTGIYSVDSPGGWNIIGHTPLVLFDPQRRGPHGQEEAMFLLKPGDTVKFVPTRS